MVTDPRQLEEAVTTLRSMVKKPLCWPFVVHATSPSVPSYSGPIDTAEADGIAEMDEVAIAATKSRRIIIFDVLIMRKDYLEEN